MLHGPLKCLCLCLAVLITTSIHDSGCHQSFVRRRALSLSAFSHHRFARRSSPSLENHQLRPISGIDIAIPATHDVQLASHQRRSIDFGPLDDNDQSRSLDLERDQAEELWEQFIESVNGEDIASYPDCEDDDQSTSESHPGSSLSDHSKIDQPVVAPPTGSSANEIGDPITSSNQSDQKHSKDKLGSNYHKEESKAREDDKKTKANSTKKVDQLPAQLEGTESKNEQTNQQAAESQKESEVEEATKQHEEEEESKKQQHAAEVEKEKKAEATKKLEAAAQRKLEAEAQKKKEIEANKKQEIEANKEQEASEAKTDDDAANKKADKGKEGYRVTDFQKIPGTSVITGTAHRLKDETYFSSPSSEEHTGDATFFTPDVGACGDANTPSDHIVAVSHLLYDSFPSQGGNPNTNTICHRMIRATYKGKSVDVKITDRCEGCDMYSLDFTESAFEKLGTKEEGRLHGMTWTFL